MALELELLDEPEEGLTFPLKCGDVVKKFTVMPAAAKDFKMLVSLRDTMLAVLTNKMTPKQANARHPGFNSTDVYRLVLGNVYEQMLNEGARLRDINRAGWVALIWHASGGNDDVAKAVWSGKDRTTIPSDKDGGEESRTPSESTSTTSTRKGTASRATRGSKSSRTKRS
jgi:hypothetical protein